MTSVALLQLCDSLFPTGAFSHSDGLETATSEGRVRTAADLRDWMDVTLDETLGRSEAPVVRTSWQAARGGRWDEVARIDAEMHALRPSSSAREASRAMGTRLVRTWRQIHGGGIATPPVGGVMTSFGGMLTLPVAFGLVCAESDIPLRDTLAGFFYTRLASTAASAMRLMAIGQHEAHGLLAAALTRVPLLVERVAASDDSPRAFTPAIDLALMSHQYVHSRLFRS